MKRKIRKTPISRSGMPVNRAHKDRLFQFVFRDKKDLLELYNAVNKTDYWNPDALVITTLEDAVFLGMKNDLSFIISATMNLYEHQSTWNANMPIRGLLYFSSLYQNYIKERGYNLYGSKRILLPFPNYLVFYNGDSRKPDQMELLLSDCFQKAGQEMPPGLECRVRLLNINHGHNREMMEKCQRLKEYADFVGEVKKNLQEGMELEGAVTAAMDDCMSRGILTDILNRCRAEVLHMLLAEYDEKETMDYIRRESREIGEKIGERRGLKKGQKIGQKIGGQKAAKRINKINYLLLSENRYEDLKRASADAKYQRKLFKDYGI